MSIKWDAETILKTPIKSLVEIITDGYDLSIMRFDLSELERAQARNNDKELVKKANSIIKCVEIFEYEAEIYLEIFEGVDFNNHFEMYQRWKEYLSTNLEFPFDTEIAEFQERGRFQSGDIIKLKKIEDNFEDLRGLLGNGEYNNSETVTFPICDLEATDKDSDNHALLKDYHIWFANQ